MTTRATLGHTGRALAAGPGTQVIYVPVLIAALLCIVAACTGSLTLLEIAGVAWIAGFTCYVLFYGPLLVLREPAWAEARC